MSYESCTTPITSFTDVDGDNYPNLRGKGVGGKWKISDKALEKYLKREESRRGQYIGRATTALVIVTKLRSALAFPSIFPFFVFFFCTRRRAGAIILLVETFDLGSSNSRYVSGTQRNAGHRGRVVCKAAG